MGTEEPPGRCFPARCGAAWGGYGAAWAAWGAPSRCPRTVRTGNSAFRVFTKQETRDTRPGYFQARGVSQREFRGFHETRVTKHESRLFSNHGLFSPWVREGGTTGNRRPDHCPRRQVAVFQFTVVHYCSPLFAIVRHCSAKKYYPAPVSSQTFLLEANQAHAHGFHETRDTKHGFSSKHGLFAESADR